jgi:hypothetical protein
MKMNNKAKYFSLIIFLFSNFFYSQSNYSFGVFFGSGLNIYKNRNETDKKHFNFKNSFSAYLGARLLKQLDEENNLFADLTYTRKKIELEYVLNESDIPFSNKDITGQKYDCISLFFGYKKIIYINEFSAYLEASIGADYNNNVMVSNKGNGETQEEINEPVYYENRVNTHLGEKSITISSNFGFGFNFGGRSQYEIGFLFNLPLQKIQTKSSSYEYIWNYKKKEYFHQIDYIGSIYYPSIKLSYYFF